jgi:two-component system, NtrC family, nitrogen regulation sensor histidine kinase NtrY
MSELNHPTSGLGPASRGLPEVHPGVMSGHLRTASTDQPKKPERKPPHLRPVWIVLILLVPCVALTLYYSQVVAPGSEESGSFLPTTSYALVLLLVNLDLIGFVVLVLLLSRNLIKAYF